MEGPDVHIIFNPTAGGGRAGRIIQKLLPEFEKRLRNQYVMHVTGAPFDAIRIARQAAYSGAKLIIAAGGDGTLQEVINGMIMGHVPVNPCCELGILDLGTGKGLAQTLAIPASHQEQFDLMVHSDACPVDAGIIRYVNSNGRPCERLFISECQIGIGSAVAERVHTGYKFLGGKIAFGLIAGIQAVCHKANRVTYQLDDQLPVTGSFIGIVIGNGSHCAGGMKLTPFARPDDGFLDMLRMYEMSIPQRLRNFPKIYTGRHIYSKHFAITQNKRVRLSSDEALWIEADGEMLGRLPCDIEILPAILKIRYKPQIYGSN